MKRRDLIKTLAIGAIPVAVCVPESTENPDILGYKFKKYVRRNNKLCRQYEKEFVSDEKGVTILDTQSGVEYLFRYKSLEPVKMTSGIYLDENSTIELCFTTISKGQKILCESYEDPTKTKVIST